ncbi:MAG: hypothetical protein JXA10_19025 [Anaerolineae bacterium]|nr:hypothetical protein [Anaerolineae bacterium]
MTAFNQDEFVAFLVRAKHATYASEGGAMIVDSLLPGAHQLEYAADRFSYRDIYYGQLHFAGQEMVFYDGNPIWSMVYAGGMLDESASLGGFLKAAMRQVSADRPFRGPESFRDGDYAYTDASHGAVDRFWGVEVITFQERAIYDLRYQGGFVR